MSVFVSTSSLNKKINLSGMISLFEKSGLKNIELGVWQKVDKKEFDVIKKSQCNFVVHQYFPPPESPFIINLSSPNKKILGKSISQIKKSIDFCRNFKIDLFTFHSGFRIDPDINFKFNYKKNSIPDYGTSFKIFKGAIKKIVKYAESKNIKLALENNVIEDHNLVKGKNLILLMVEYWEFEKLFKEVPSENFGMLLDLGHLNVSANILNFNKYEFIEKIKDRVFAIHFHENSGRKDEHKKIKKNSWCLKAINKWFQNKKIPLIMEGHYSSIKELTNSKNLIEKLLK